MKKKNIFKKYKEKYRNRQKEVDRDLDFFDSYFFHFLKLIFEKGEINKKTLMKKRRLKEDKFNLFTNMALSKEYIFLSLNKKEKGNDIYGIKNEGIDFLLNFKRLREEGKHSNVIKWVMIVLAISAFIQASNIWVNEPETRNWIILIIGNIFAGILTIIQELIPLAILILLIYIIFKIWKKGQKDFPKKTPPQKHLSNPTILK